MLGTPEGARRRTNALVENMLAEDAYRHDYEAMPPRDPDVPEMSVMDTAFISPEEHRMLAHQSYVDAANRQLEAENQGLIRDYPEDYLTAATGVYGLGKGLTKYALKKAANRPLYPRLKPRERYQWHPDNMRALEARRAAADRMGQKIRATREAKRAALKESLAKDRARREAKKAALKESLIKDRHKRLLRLWNTDGSEFHSIPAAVLMESMTE